MFTIKVDYPSLDEEKRILSMTSKDEAVELTKVLSEQGDQQLAKADSRRARWAIT